MFQSNLARGGSIAAGESSSQRDRVCACAQMESQNLIPFNCLLRHFVSILELRLGSLTVLGSPFGQQISVFFSDWL